MRCYFKLDDGTELNIAVLENKEILEGEEELIAEFGVEETNKINKEVEEDKQMCYFTFYKKVDNKVIKKNNLIVTNITKKEVIESLLEHCVLQEYQEVQECLRATLIMN